MRDGAPCFYDVRDIRADTKQGYVVTNEPPQGFGSPAQARPEAVPNPFELADDILVMYAGRAIEYGPASEVFSSPQHPYTWGLLGSVPRWDRQRSQRLAPIPGSPPSLITVPSGCPFHPRCRYAELTGGQASTTRPELRPAGSAGHLVACHLSDGRRQQILDDEIRPKL